MSSALPSISTGSNSSGSSSSSSSSSAIQSLPIPSSAATYREKSYWDGRFEVEEFHEWLADWEVVSSTIETLIPSKSARILLVGCGNSRLTAEMVTLGGYTNLVSTDYSEVVIEKMKRLYGAALGDNCTWEVADMLKLPYPDASFDVVFDKAAMDAVLAGGGDCWDPEEETLAKSDTIMGEAARVLRPGGCYIQISFGQPHFRRLHILQKFESRWKEFKKYDVPAGLGYFLYHLTT